MAYPSDRFQVFDDASRRLDQFGLLLATVSLSIVALSLVDLRADGGSWVSGFGGAIVTTLVGAMLLLALTASGVVRRWRRIASVVVVLGIAATWILVVLAGLADVSPAAGDTDAVSPSLVWVGLAAISPVVVVRRLLQHRRVTSGTLLGAISAFLLIALSFTFLFLAVEAYTPEPFFSQPEATTAFMYYSLVTISTLGYGDLSASSDLGRLFSVAEAIVGQVYLVTFVAMIVGLLSQSRQRGASGDE